MNDITKWFNFQHKLIMFKNKTALITGSNRGIGLAIVKEFSKHGCNIISCVRKINDETRKQFEKISSEFKMILRSMKWNWIKYLQIRIFWKNFY